MDKRLIILVLVVNQCFGVIYRLNDSVYEHMPPLIHLDDYENCFNDPNALYCTSQFRLVSNTRNELYNMIANYSEWQITHYDHTKLYRGICVRRSCGTYYNEEPSNITYILEACLNQSLWEDYGLQTKLLNVPSCRSADDRIEFEDMDLVVTVLCAAILIVNVAATLYDLYSTQERKSKGVDIILAFSLLRNWPRLFQADYRSRPFVDRLKCLDGLRAILMILLVTGHCFIPFAISIANPHFLEEVYHILPYHVFLNGAVIVQAFFLMSGLFLSYSIQKRAEKTTVKCTLLISSIWKRWLRLTPSFAVTLAFTATLLRFISSGPLVKLLDLTEIEDCRSSWMWNIFYLINYKCDSQCMPQTWYLAADLHLYVLGMMIFVLMRNTFWRNMIMMTLFVIGVVSSGLVTYFYDLTFLMSVTPRMIIRLFVEDPAFNNLYRPSHTNIPCFVMGLALGNLIHNLQKTDFNLNKYKKFLPIYWALVPCCVGIPLLSSLNHMDGPPYPLYIRVIFHTLLRPVTGALVAAVVFGMVFKYDKFYRGFLEWHGWAWVARVSYGTYLIHLNVIRILLGNATKLFTVSILTIVAVIGMVTISFIAGTIIWLLIDAPVNELVKIWLEAPVKKTAKQTNEAKTNDIDIHVEKL